MLVIASVSVSLSHVVFVQRGQQAMVCNKEH
ncbi:hypothetical protein Rcae01_03059 [Novipirellula caenicola]|uniref:Uncharacterized protein n=1 Tax=Novipirellula caenicola TaxID=1536901 RepID=A0ABP9VR32_9BACT